jgi:Sec7 domain
MFRPRSVKIVMGRGGCAQCQCDPSNVTAGTLKLLTFVCRNDFNVNVLKAFVHLHEFQETILVQALRYDLQCFGYFAPITKVASFY